MGITCIRCNVLKSSKYFMSEKTGKMFKQCQRCRDKEKETRAKRPKCPHDKLKRKCIECSGCPHKKIKNNCIECSGCPHKKIKNNCNICKGCPHGKYKRNCYECTKCPHGKRKQNCIEIECSGCPHMKIKYTCVSCNGSSLCPHKKLKYRCQICEGSIYCKHGREKQKCRECIKYPVKQIILNMIYNSKKSDKKKKRYDADNFIDYPFIEQLLFECKTCPYCRVEMNFLPLNKALCTIERINNDMGHIKSNCILCCHTCNIGRIGQKTK